MKQNFTLQKFQKMICCYFQENRSQSNDFYNWIQIFALIVKDLSTEINLQIYNLISSLVCVLYRLDMRSVRTFDKYTWVDQKVLKLILYRKIGLSWEIESWSFH